MVGFIPDPNPPTEDIGLLYIWDTAVSLYFSLKHNWKQKKYLINDNKGRTKRKNYFYCFICNIHHSDKSSHPYFTINSKNFKN